MDKGLIELLRQSEALVDRGDPTELMNSSVWDAAVCGVTRLVVELRGINQADIAHQLQSELDRLESGIEEGMAEKTELWRTAKYRRWSAFRRLISDVEGIVRLAERSSAFLDEHDPSLNWLNDETECRAGHADFIPTPAMMNILTALSEAKTTIIQVDIEQASGEPIKTVKSLMPELETLGFVHRPHGKRKGYSITDKGRELLTRESQAGG